MDCESMPYDPMLAVLLRAEDDVRRDDDYLRKMLSDMEASTEWMHYISGSDAPGDSEDKAMFHAKLLEDEGLLQRITPGIYRMTARGHDFVAATADDTVWERSKQAVGHLKQHSVRMLLEVAEGYVRVKLREITGLDL